MSRSWLLGLSLIDCAFGAVALTAEDPTADRFLMLNFALALLLAILSAQDLRNRGWRWQSYAVGASYLIAPLVGLVLYALLSNRPTLEPSNARA